MWCPYYEDGEYKCDLCKNTVSEAKHDNYCTDWNGTKVYCFLTFKKLTFLPKYGIMSINYEGVVPHSSLHMCELNQQHAVRLV